MVKNLVDFWYYYGIKSVKIQWEASMVIDNAISNSLFQNLLGLFSDEGVVDVEATRKFLRISKAQLASVFGLSVDQIRLDRMGEVTKTRIDELASALEFVAETFEGDEKKTLYWLNTPNPNFGGTSPKKLILEGRYHKVVKFILAAKKGY